jgi:XTP/dITP diphosphohydrolase
MDKVLFGSLNKGKCAEARLLASEIGLNLCTPDQLIDQCGTPPDVIEGYASYYDNARLKAEAFFAWAKMPAIGDDSGLEVSALNGAPGVITARFAGEGATSAANRAKLLHSLKDKKDRTAQFRCVLNFYDGKEHLVVEEILVGAIAQAERGEEGFGYDPIFELPEGKTLAELRSQQSIDTHRVRALRRMFQLLAQRLV